MDAATYGSRHWCVPHRDCRKESKELLVRPEPARRDVASLTEMRHHVAMASMAAAPDSTAEDRKKASGGTKTAEKAVFAEVNPLITSLDAEIAKPTGKIQQGKGQAIIGGGCCVELAIEYMPTPPLVSLGSGGGTVSLVLAAVTDSEGAILMWSKLVAPGYHVKEGIITTYPGALLHVQVINAIARVRWCEIFSG
jgi:hypothetical protein